MAVVKADAYGHGLVPVAREVIEGYEADTMGHPVGTGPFMVTEFVDGGTLNRMLVNWSASSTWNTPKRCSLGSITSPDGSTRASTSTG